MSDTIYTQFLNDLANGTEDWDGSATYRVMLLGNTSTYTPNKDHKFVSDVTSNGGVEFSGGSYARQTLGTRTVTQDDTNDRSALDAADVSFGALNTDTVKGIVVYQRVGADDSTPADDRLVCAYDSVAAGLPLATNGGTVTVTINAAGLMTLAQA